MPLKLNVGLCRKVGLPEFSSVGASCNLEVELDAGLARDHAALQLAIADAYATCRAAVDAELGRHQHATPSPNAPRPAPEGGSQRSLPPQPANGHHAKERIEWGGRQPAVGTATATRPKTADAPKSGKALFAWVRDREEDHGPGLLKYLSGWAKLQEFPTRFVEWDAQQVAQAHAEALRKINNPHPED